MYFEKIDIIKKISTIYVDVTSKLFMHLPKYQKEKKVFFFIKCQKGYANKKIKIVT